MKINDNILYKVQSIAIDFNSKLYAESHPALRGGIDLISVRLEKCIICLSTTRVFDFQPTDRRDGVEKYFYTNFAVFSSRGE